MKIQNAEKIEALAREMCEADGNDPDAIVTRNILAEKAAPGGIIRYLPEKHYCFPAWQAYSHLAQIADAHCEHEEVCPICCHLECQCSEIRAMDNGSS